MLKIIPRDSHTDEFLNWFYSYAYRLQNPITAVAITDINASDLLKISIKKGCSLSVIDISLYGWCYIQIGDKFGFCRCMYLQLQQEILDVPAEYIRQFHPPEKSDNCSISTTLVGNWTHYSYSNSIFKPNISADNTSKAWLNDDEKNKKSKKIKDKTCQECGTNSTPEWRSGPKGKKSLCNACGIRWSKIQKLETKDIKAEVSNQSDAEKRLTPIIHKPPTSKSKSKDLSTGHSVKSSSPNKNIYKLEYLRHKNDQALENLNGKNNDSEPINKSSLSFILS